MKEPDIFSHHLHQLHKLFEFFTIFRILWFTELLQNSRITFVESLAEPELLLVQLDDLLELCVNFCLALKDFVSHQHRCNILLEGRSVFHQR